MTRTMDRQDHAGTSSAAGRITRGPTPAYYQILQILRMQIASGTYPVGSRLPTDGEIMREYAVSRHTARAAVQNLVIDGLAQRFPGKGTFVLERGPAKAAWGARSLDDILNRSFGGSPEVIGVETIPARSGIEFAMALGVGADQALFRVRQLRRQDGAPVTYTSMYTPLEYGLRLPSDFAERIRERRLLSFIEEACGVRAHKVRQIIKVVTATADASSVLKVKPGSPLLAMYNTYSERSGRPIETTEILCRPDRYQHTVEFFRHDDQQS